MVSGHWSEASSSQQNGQIGNNAVTRGLFPSQQLRRSHTSKKSKHTAKSKYSSYSRPTKRTIEPMSPITSVGGGQSIGASTITTVDTTKKTTKSGVGIPLAPPTTLLPLLAKFKRQRGYIDSDNEEETDPTPTRSNMGGMSYSSRRPLATALATVRAGAGDGGAFNHFPSRTSSTGPETDESSSSESDADYYESYTLTGLSSVGDSTNVSSIKKHALGGQLGRTNHTYSSSKMAETRNSSYRDPMDEANHTISQTAETIIPNHTSHSYETDITGLTSSGHYTGRTGLTSHHMTE